MAISDSLASEREAALHRLAEREATLREIFDSSLGRDRGYPLL